MRQGWHPRYKIWVEHGEPAPPTPPPVIDNTRKPLMSDMTTLLNDLSYIPPNNEHSEPTQGDIGETSNEPTQATRHEFEELYASANDMIWHATGKCMEPGKMQHPVDGGAWKKFDTKYPDFAKEPRNVRLGLAADGFNPFGNMSSADVARSHRGDGGGDDHPPSHVVPTGCGGCFANKAKRKPNLGGRGVGRLNTRNKTRNLSLKDIEEAKGPVSISFDVGDKQTLNPLGPHAAYWSNYIWEVVRSVPLYYPSWEKVPKERKATIISNIGTLFDLRPHMESSRWTEIYEGINMHLQKAYNTNKASFKAKHWKADPTTGSYNVEAIRRARPEEFTAAEWDKYIQFWNDPKNLARAAQNRLNRQKSVVTSRQGSWSLARLRDEMRQASDTHEYPSLIDTFWRTHTVDGVFPKDEDRRVYEEMKKAEATRVSNTEDEISMRWQEGYASWAHSRSVGQMRTTCTRICLRCLSRVVQGSGGCGDVGESGVDEDGDCFDD
ncbi:F-box domain containing protein [Tanacetum coccineum]